MLGRQATNDPLRREVLRGPGFFSFTDPKAYWLGFTATEQKRFGDNTVLGETVLGREVFSLAVTGGPPDSLVFNFYFINSCYNDETNNWVTCYETIMKIRYNIPVRKSKQSMIMRLQFFRFRDRGSHRTRCYPLITDMSYIKK